MTDMTPKQTELSFPIVGIGASAGGIKAISLLLQHLPASTGAAFVVILHLDPDRYSHLGEVLGRQTRMQTVAIVDGMLVEPDRVYVIAPNCSVLIEGGRFRLKTPDQPRSLRRPVDELFESLALASGERAVAVIMSGTGTNGSAALAQIKANGGTVLVQDPRSADFSGMPANAIDTGLVDQVLEPEAMAETIIEYINSAYVAAVEKEEIAEQQFKAILDLLQSDARLDLGGYRRPTITRRVNRRMGLKGAATLDAYLAILREDARERESLTNDLLINVTGFFRDPLAWEALEKHVIAPLMRSKEPGSALRCWVPACSTGEEAYTLGILLTEQTEASGKDLDIKIFATDLAKHAIARARAGVYPAGICTQMSDERLSRFFEKQDDHYRVAKAVREKVVFAPHNILMDPPFSHLDIVTCRNVLIYLEPETQRKVLGVLHFALRAEGYLMLGSSESANRDDAIFHALDSKHRIYRRIGPARQDLFHFPVNRMGASDSMTRAANVHSSKGGIAPMALQAVASLIPGAVLLDARNRVLYFHGNTDAYLSHPDGQANLDVHSMARTGLEAPIRSAVARARSERGSATADAVISRGGDSVRVHVTATMAGEDRSLMLLSFEEKSAEPERPVVEGENKGNNGNDESLHQELRQSHAELARTIAELETVNDDLKASNEEVMSINEELQSTNEELETSKEELQSLNEELSTVNVQLQTKLEELETTGNNLANLLNSSDIATLFLSHDMKVRWFTPAVSRLFSLIETDIGRPITDFAQKFVDGDILDDCRKVLTALVPVKTEIQDSQGQWYLRRVAPYRTSEDKIDGVVITFADITEAKQYEKKLRRAAANARKAAEAKDDFLARLSHELRTPLHPALLGLSGLARRTDLPGEVAEKISSITRNIEIEVRLIDDLLDLTRVRHGKLHLEREQLDALDLINESVQLCRDDSAAKQLNVVVHGTPQTCIIEVDKLRIQQVMWNLMRNAIRFARMGGTIELRCERRDHRVLLEVKDDGAGIPADLLPRVFDSFERSDEPFGGLGLGLSIAKSFVEAHGGRIEAESPGRGKGSTFRVWLPAGDAAPVEVNERDTASDPGAGASGESTTTTANAQGADFDLTGLNILLVEDHPDSAEMLASLLQALGGRTRIAGSVREARTAVHEESFDLLLSDLALPDGTGHEFVAELEGKIPAIALSGLGTPEDQKRSAKAGFSAHLVKPLTLSRLTAAIANAMPLQGVEGRSAPVLH